MKYALLNNERIKAQKGIKNAICPICEEIVIPKCGQIKIHHWAHKNKENCDPWWENETEWHRQWKNNFSKEYQEIIQYDPVTGEKHVADVKTKTGIVLEFQHSYMEITEQHSREKFYKNMIWVIDARKYYDKFKDVNRTHCYYCKNKQRYFYIKVEPPIKNIKCFPAKWLTSNVPVVFDFGVHNNTINRQEKWLWCIFPEKYTKNLRDDNSKTLCLCCLYLKKDEFIKRVSNFDSFYPNNVLSELEELMLEKEKNKNK